MKNLPFLFCLCFLLAILTLSARAQQLVPDTSTIYGGSKPFTQVFRSIPTRDGGTLLVGNTLSNDGDFTPRVPDLNADSSFPEPNAFAARLDSNGHLQWAKLFGGSGGDYFSNATELSNGDFAVAGSTTSNDYDLAGKFIGGYGDAWLLRIDASGNLLWSRTYGSTRTDFASSVVETTNGGLLLLCSTSGSDSDALYHYGISFYPDWLLIRTDNAGNRIWRRMIVGSDDEGGDVNVGNNLYKAPDGGYYLVGYSKSDDSDLKADNPSPDGAKITGVVFLRLDSAGKRVWCKHYGAATNPNSGGVNYGSMLDLRDTTLVAVGLTRKNDHHFTGNHTNQGTLTDDMFLVKVDRNGDLIRSRLYGTIQDDIARGIAPTPDGGYLITGSQLVDSPYLSANNGSYNVALYLIDKTGNEIHSKVYGGTYRSVGYDEGYGAVCRGKRWLITGSTSSMYFTTGKSNTRPNGGFYSTSLDYWPLAVSQTEVPANRSFSLSPNPAHSSFEVQFAGRQNGGQIVCTGSSGAIIYRQTVPAGETHIPIATAHWVPGTYLLCWQPAVEAQQQCQTLVVQ